MKLYKFYKINLNHRKDLPVLYAFTSSKELASRFRKERDMSIFEMIVTDVSKAEYKFFSKTKNMYELHIAGLYTKEHPNSNKCVVVKTLITNIEEERSAILSDTIMSELGKHLFNTKAFNDEYLNALNDIRFIDFYCFYKMGINESYDYFYSGMEIPKRDGNDVPIKMRYDELGLFIYFFGYTLKGMKTKKEETE